MTELEQAEARFKRAQEALETFVQEHVTVTLAGAEFLSNETGLACRLAALRAELDRCGREWYEALQANKVMQ